jgi:hypothetical protein
MKDIEGWMLDYIRENGQAPNLLVLDPETGKDFTRHPAMKEWLEIIRHNRTSSFDPELKKNGVSFIGSFSTSYGELDVIIYNEWSFKPTLSANGTAQFDDSGEMIGTNVPLLPTGTAILTSDNIKHQFHYGLIQNEYGLHAAEEFPLIWTAPNGSARYIQLESAPLPCIVDPTAFIVAKVK